MNSFGMAFVRCSNLSLISKNSPGVPIILHTMYGSALPLEVEKHGVSRVVAKAETGTLVKAVQELSEGNRAA